MYVYDCNLCYCFVNGLLLLLLLITKLFTPAIVFMIYGKRTYHIYCPKIFKSKTLVYKTRQVMTLQDTSQQVSPLLVCYHAKPSVDLDNKCHPYLYVIMPNQVWTWTTSVILTCMLSCQTKCGPGQQVSPLFVCYHAKPSVDLDNKCHPYLYVIMPNQVWTWTTSVTPICMLSCQTKCGPGQ